MPTGSVACARGESTPPLASWTVLLAGVLDGLVLIALTAIGLGATGRVPLGLAVLALAVLGAGSAAAWAVVMHPAVLRRLPRPLLWLGRFVPGRGRQRRQRGATELDGLAQRVTERLTLLRPSRASWALLLALTTLTWLLDFADLTAAAAAVLQPVPWPALVTGYLVVQAGIALQILPGAPACPMSGSSAPWSPPAPAPARPH